MALHNLNSSAAEKGITQKIGRQMKIQVIDDQQVEEHIVDMEEVEEHVVDVKQVEELMVDVKEGIPLMQEDGQHYVVLEVCEIWLGFNTNTNTNKRCCVHDLSQLPKPKCMIWKLSHVQVIQLPEQSVIQVGPSGLQTPTTRFLTDNEQ